MLLISLTGLLYMLDNGGWRGKFHENIGAQSIGGWLGCLTYGQTPHYEYGFSLLGTVGATIVYATLCLISLLFLTDFRLGEWIRGFLEKAHPPPPNRNRNPPRKPRWTAARANWKSRPRNCRRKSPAPGSARICSRCRNRPCAI